MRSLLLSLVVLLAACETNTPAVSDAGTTMMGADSGAMTGADAGPTTGTDAGADGVDAGPSGIDAGATMGGMCPPAGPYGMAAGDIAADITLTDCDGVEHTLHSLCENRAIWLFEFADWCPPCRAFASTEVNNIYDRFAGDDFEAYMIVSADSGFGAPDAADCAEIRTRYDIHMPVLFDPTGAFQSNFGVPSNEVNIVLSDGVQIEWVGQYSANMVETRIEGVLAP